MDDVVEVLPRRLGWAEQGTVDEGPWRVVTLESIATSGTRTSQAPPTGRRLSVSKTKSLDHGPLPLDQMLCFMHHLQRELDAGGRKGRPVLVAYPASETGQANLAVLLGAFLILRLGWTLQAVDRVLCLESGLTFSGGQSSAWARTDSIGSARPAATTRRDSMGPRQRQQRPLSVRDCWAALEISQHKGWLPVVGPAIDDAVVVELAKTQHWKALMEINGVWLVPGHLLVLADPMQTVMDSHPSTLSRLYSEGAVAEKRPDDEDLQLLHDCPHLSEPSTPRSTIGPLQRERMPEPKGKLLPEVSKPKSKVTCVDDWDDVSTEVSDADGEARPSQPEVLEASNTMQTDRVQLLQPSPNGMHEGKAHQVPGSFTSYFLTHQVGTIVRANSDGDLAATGPLSYSPKDLEQFGLQHFECSGRNLSGGVPTKGTIISFLSSAHSIGFGSESEEVKALAVHCTRGTGRSMVLACCLMVLVYDVPGRLVLAWARICRPGAFATSQQETFLNSLTGRWHLKQYLGFGSDQGQQQCCVVL